MANEKNVIVTIPKVGDIVALGADSKIKYIALDTYDSATFPAGWTLVGVVAVKQGKQVMIVHKSNAGKKWSDVMRWEITGAALTDGESHTQNFVANGVTVAITWQTSTLSSFAQAVNGYISGQDFGGHSYRCIYDANADKVYLFHDTFNAWKEPTFAGVTLTRAIGETIPQNSSSYRKTGRSVYWGVINLNRAVEYYKTNGSTPTANVPVNISSGDSPVKLTEFKTSAYCADIRNAYCADPTEPTDNDYKNYVEHEFSAEFPSNRASMAEMYRDGHAFTYALVGKKYLASDNTQKDLYPAAEYCAAVSYNDAKGELAAGKWFLPSKFQMGHIWSKLTYGLSGVTRAASDPVNRSLNAIGGSAISCAGYAWSSALYSSNVAWIYNGDGNFSYGYFYYAFTCVPCVLLTLSDSEA